MKYVYLIGDDTGMYKIGTTTDLDQRLKSLQAASSRPLTILHFIDVEPFGYEVERALHKKYRRFRKHGEWFKLPAASVSVFCKLDRRKSLLIYRDFPYQPGRKWRKPLIFKPLLLKRAS